MDNSGEGGEQVVRIVWNRQTVDWFRRASQYTGYNRALGVILRAHIPAGTTLCDVGCGAGLIDLELASHCGHITCVDIAPGAVEAVRQEATARGIANLTALCRDGAELEGEWDTVLALFHGGSCAMQRYFPHARQRLILGVYDHPRGSFGPAHRKRLKQNGAAQVQAALDEMGVVYTVERHALEHGQPLRSWEEAQAFVQAYCQPMEGWELEEYLQAHLRSTGRDDFPYYLPKTKAFSLFVVPREGNQGVCP